jgi:hypothetical protein
VTQLPQTDEDDADPALIVLSQKVCPEIVAEIAVVDALCGANTGNAIVVVAGADANSFNYLWSNGVTANEVSNLPSGNYSVTIIDKANTSCKTVKNVFIGNINGPIISAIPTPANCGVNGTVKITVLSGAGPFTINWSGAAIGTTNLPGLGSYDITGPIGIYNIEVISSNGCKDYTRTEIKSNPSGLSITASPNTRPDCKGNNGSIVINILGGTPNYKYYLNGILMATIPGTNYTINNLVAGEYIVKVVDSKLCEATSKVVLEPQGPPQVNPSKFTIIDATCSGGLGKVTFNGGGPQAMFMN